MRYSLLSFILILVSAGLMAQENQLVIDASFMTRGEVRAGGLPTITDENQVKRREDFASFVLEKTLLGLDFSKKNFSSKVTAQHSGTWGSSEGGQLNIYEAWFKIQSEKGLFMQIGRQNLSYDDQRIFGSDDWAMTARSHDVLKTGFENRHQKIHFFFAFNQNSANINGGTYYTGGVQPYKAMEAAWYHYDIPKSNLGISLLFMNAGMQGGEKGETNEKTYQQQLFGSYMTFKPKDWVFEGAYYRQMGKEEHGLPIEAWMSSIKGTYSPNSKWSFYSGYDHLSGDDNFATPDFGQIGVTQHKTINGFSSLYGSHHKFYGAMDFFYVTTYVRGFTPGLQNAYIGAKWTPGEKVGVDLAYHYLATSSYLQNADRPLGHEVELSASYSFSKEAKLSIGYSYMRGTHTMVVLKKSSEERVLNWGWVMFNVTPRFLNGKW